MGLPTTRFRTTGFLSLLLLLVVFSSSAQESVARKWNEVLLEAIRNDFARPTIHARNLFHTSAAMYDAWAAYDPVCQTYLLGQSHRAFYCPFDGVQQPSDIAAARREAISHAAYRLIYHRFLNSPGAQFTLQLADDLMSQLGFDPDNTSVDYSSGDPAALGNYIARKMIEYGFQDGSNEQLDYRNAFYEPINPPLLPTREGNEFIIDPNRWQPLFLDTFIDQSGNPIPVGQIEFQSPEWGLVDPFSLKNLDLSIYERDSSEYWMYYDPGAPPMMEEDGQGTSSEYMWGFSLVSVWGAHLDPNDGVIWDVSPGAIGNTIDFPSSHEGLRDFYNRQQGGDTGRGHDVNPATGAPYPAQLVPRGDYTRVLAEFWADGPDSETPPGHWFTILNYVNDHPQFEKRFRGQGDVLDDLEWDIKAYFTLGGAMHDAAIAAWGIKGYYDYVRPISAIRYMADQGQSTDPSDLSYHVEGVPLEPGFIELVRAGDQLAGSGDENVGKIKVFTWRGPDYISDPDTDFAGVGWILAENWWPYQRPTFVTPPFAGYVSGHSTFSRAAAEVMTLLTGDEYFPGGIGEFVAEKDKFLVFEQGPSVDVILQWATYYDASDQTSLSRIWGGIHPPADDIPGRLIGMELGKEAFAYAEKYFQGLITGTAYPETDRLLNIYPNPTRGQVTIKTSPAHIGENFRVVDSMGRVVHQFEALDSNNLDLSGLVPGIYILHGGAGSSGVSERIIITN